MTEPLRVALLGYGLAGSVFHAPFIAAVDGLDLAVVTTSDAGRRREAEERYLGVLVLDGPDEVFARADELDLVVVATPNTLHLSHALAALEAGLPVVVDKPLTPTAEEARKLVGEARERHLMLTVFQNRRWDGDFQTVRRLVAEGTLGTVHRFESRIDRWRPELTGAWRERADEAGGLLLDLGTHLVDQALHLFGPAQLRHAEVDALRAGAEVEDDVFLALEHASGERSHLWMSLVAAQPGAALPRPRRPRRLRQARRRPPGGSAASRAHSGRARLWRRAARALGAAGSRRGNDGRPHGAGRLFGLLQRRCKEPP